MDYVICSICGETIGEPEVIPAHGHYWDNPEWTWSSNYTKVSAKFTCEHDSSHTTTIDGKVEMSSTEPTCTENGRKLYVAKITVDNRTYQQAHAEVVIATGHSYGEPTWTWNSVSSATATFTCGNNTSHIEKANAAITSKTTATCTADGEMTYTAKVTFNGKEYIATKVIADTAKGHSFGEWKTVIEATNEKDGKMIRECSACTAKEEKIIPKLAVTIKDEESGIELVVPNGAYNGDIILEIEEVFDGKSFQIVDALNNVENTRIFDIKTTLNGVEVQPSTALTVRIPLPAGYTPDRTFIYYVNTETGKVENMKARVENGFLVFEATHFSYYSIVEFEEPVSFVIRNPSKTTINYGDSIILHADIEGTLPEGAKIVWSANNGNFAYTPSDDGTTCVITPVSSGDTEFTAKVVDENGKEISEPDTQIMTSKAGFIQKILAFLKKIFGTTKVLPYAFKGIF